MISYLTTKSYLILLCFFFSPFSFSRIAKMKRWQAPKETAKVRTLGAKEDQRDIHWANYLGRFGLFVKIDLKLLTLKLIPWYSFSVKSFKKCTLAFFFLLLIFTLIMINVRNLRGNFQYDSKVLHCFCEQQSKEKNELNL